MFENVGEAVWPAAMKSLVRGGRLVTCGATSGDQPPADLRRIFIRQLQILGSTHGDLAEFHDLLRFVTRHAIGKADTVPLVPEPVDGGPAPELDQQAMQDHINAIRSISWWRAKYGPILDAAKLANR